MLSGFAGICSREAPTLVIGVVSFWLFFAFASAETRVA